MLLLLFLSTILSFFSTAIMSYITMATPIGPWIAPTLVLMAGVIGQGIFRQKLSERSFALPVCAGSIGGILATAYGFSFPTLYFLDPVLFATWMSNPWFFVLALGVMALAAGSFGMWIADVLEHQVIVQDELPFPIGQLVYKMIAVHDVRKGFELALGFVATAIFCIFQNGIRPFFASVIPASITLIRPVSWWLIRIPAVAFDLWPLLWAIGFVTGHVVALPLLVGAASKLLLVDPLNRGLFAQISSSEFVLAFCSGMVLAGALASFISFPAALWRVIKTVRTSGFSFKPKGTLRTQHIYELAGVLLLCMAFLSYFKFSLLAQLFLLVGTFICTYQIIYIAGKIGLAQLGRFATFVMVPAMFLFSLDYVQIVIVATFVEICGGVATDILFGRKIGHLMKVPTATMRRYQYLGLVVSALTIGIVFWLLIDHFQLGSAVLVAQRSQARQLLIHAQHFDYYVLALGFLFGYLLKFTRVSPMLVLGGLLMPLNISLGLMVGGLLTVLVKNKEEWYPFWSGVFAANSLWMLIKTLL